MKDLEKWNEMHNFENVEIPMGEEEFIDYMNDKAYKNKTDKKYVLIGYKWNEETEEGEEILFEENELEEATEYYWDNEWDRDFVFVYVDKRIEE